MDYQFKAWMIPKIKRIMHGFKPYKWCQALAETYEYPDSPDDVYRRHQNCYWDAINSQEYRKNLKLRGLIKKSNKRYTINQKTF